MQTIESAGLTLGDMVLYSDPNKGYVPAMIETIFPAKDEDDPPELALVVFITGYAGCAFPVSRAKFGKDKGQWVLREHGKEFAEDPEKALNEIQKRHLEALQELADLNKEPSEPDAPPPSAPVEPEKAAPPPVTDAEAKPEDKPKKPAAK